MSHIIAPTVHHPTPILEDAQEQAAPLAEARPAAEAPPLRPAAAGRPLPPDPLGPPPLPNLPPPRPPAVPDAPPAYTFRPASNSIEALARYRIVVNEYKVRRARDGTVPLPKMNEKRSTRSCLNYQKTA
jgi:hypothetical protein